MKLLSFIVFLSFSFLSFGQLDKIGFSKIEVLNSFDKAPCKSSYNSVWYCSENGSLINYSFTSEKVSSVLYMWEFNSKMDADLNVRNETSKYTKIYGKPTMKGDQAFWFVGNYLVMCSYGNTNGKHYSTWRVSMQ
jgi:hypothetical protein